MLRALVLLLALLAGGGAGLLGWRAMGEAETQGAPEPAPTREILIVARDLAPGEALGEGDLVWRSWPEAAVQTAYIERGARPEAAAELTGRMARLRLVAGEPALEAKLAEAGANLLAVSLREGERAVAVRISAENTAGGFILPGDRVDVLHTRLTNGGAGETAAILRNVEVLAIDQTAEEETQGALVGKTATLRLTLVQAERLIAAEATGKLSLALRAAADRNAPEPAPEPEAPPARRAAAAAAEAEPLSIRVRRAGAVETVTLP